jgi:hypothetical protein
MLRIRRASGVAKPRVGIRGVIDDEIDDDANASLLAAVMNSTKSPSVPYRGSTP